MDHTMIAGHVVEAVSQAPVAGARVTLIKIVEVPGGTFGEEPRQALTDARGQFAFQRITPGQYRVDVEKSGFAPSFDPFDSTLLELNTEHSITGLQIALKRGGVVSGGVRDAEGEPRPEMTVSAMRLTPAGRRMGPEMIQGGVGQTNDLGEFRIANLPEGEYVVIAADHAGMPFGLRVPPGATVAAAPTYYPGTTERQAAQVISIGAGKTVAGLWFSIVSAPAFNVSGVVVDEAGTPLGGAMVTLMPISRPEMPFAPVWAPAERDGTFHIGGVLPGAYHISATARADSGTACGVFEFFEQIAVVDDGAGADPVVLFETHSSRQSNTVTVENANVGGVRVVVTSPG